MKHQIFITPLWFGLGESFNLLLLLFASLLLVKKLTSCFLSGRIVAHVHHAYDVFTSNGKTKQAFKTAFFTCRSFDFLSLSGLSFES